MTVSQNITIKDVFHQPLLLWDPTWNHTEVKSRTSETTTYVSIPMLLWYMVCSLLNWSSYLFTHSLVNEIGKLWPFVEWTGPTIFLIGAQLYRVNFLFEKKMTWSEVLFNWRLIIVSAFFKHHQKIGERMIQVQWSPMLQNTQLSTFKKEGFLCGFALQNKMQNKKYLPNTTKCRILDFIRFMVSRDFGKRSLDTISMIWMCSRAFLHMFWSALTRELQIEKGKQDWQDESDPQNWHEALQFPKLRWQQKHK